MKRCYIIAGIAALSCFRLLGEIVSFPSVPWSSTRVVNRGNSVQVLDENDKPFLFFTTEGGNFANELVITPEEDHLSIDANKAFEAGMRKLVFTSSNFNPAPYGEKFCTLVSDFGGAGDVKMLQYFEGHGKGRHFYRSANVVVSKKRASYPASVFIESGLDSLHLRYDITTLAKEGEVCFYGAKYGLDEEFTIATAKAVKPKLLFHATFDDTLEGDSANGKVAPLKSNGVEFVAGKFNKAVRLTHENKSALEYPATNILNQERGTVSLWFKREWPDQGTNASGREVWRALFGNNQPKGARLGSGQLQLWYWGPNLRADQSDSDDSYVMYTVPTGNGLWTHLAVTWDNRGAKIYVNGKSSASVSDGYSPIKKALENKLELQFSREYFKSFCVGSIGDDMQFDGLIDDLRIYSAPLSGEQIHKLWKRDADMESGLAVNATGCYAVEGKELSIAVSVDYVKKEELEKLKYCIVDATGKIAASFNEAVSGKTAILKAKLPAGVYELRTTNGDKFFGSAQVAVFKKGNKFERKGIADAGGVIGNLELVDELALDKIPDSSRFKAVGPVEIKTLNGRSYLEAGQGDGDRYALHFKLDKNVPLYVFDIEYPDDKKRTADILIQRADIPSDYTMQCGYATGDEYANTGKMLTHRVMFWNAAEDVAIIAMTARKDAPAAIASVKIYKVKDGALPPAKIAGVEQTQEGRPALNRIAALYFEDPAITYDFSIPGANSNNPMGLDELIDKTAALMKFTGENLLAYPGAWYHGIIGKEYNPRNHATDFLSAWYSKFDEEGLFLVPTINLNTMKIPEDLVTRKSLTDGSLHDSVIAIHDTGRPNWGGWHDTPPNFNFAHKQAREYVAGVIDTLIEQGAGHPSFKGICMHLTRHCFEWFGDDVSGYNDYAVEAFAKDRKIKLPPVLKNSGAMRGKAYATWIRQNYYEDWIQWRCDIVSSYYIAIARKLAAKRPDLRLWLNYMVPADVSHPDFIKPHFMKDAWRRAGLDAKRIDKEAKNIILGQTMVPADYRWRTQYPSEDVRNHQRILDTLPGFYENIVGSGFPLVHQHDRYWESAIGRSAYRGASNTLSCEWLKECTWRVSTINPSGYHALRHFVEPLRYGDILGVSKGGFLIGTYGMEDVLVPFLQAFRALPAVVFDDVAAVGDVRVRAKTYDGKSWFYVVNTSDRKQKIKIEFPAKTVNLVSGEVYKGGLFGGAEKLELELAPYEMRSYSAPKGKPKVQ